MHTGYYFGFLFAALANYFIGSHYGWRCMFVVGGLPALLVALIRNNVKEPERWENRREELGKDWTMHRSFFLLFSKQYLRRTIFNSIYLIVSLVGLWAGSVYVPAAMTLHRRGGRTRQRWKPRNSRRIRRRCWVSARFSGRCSCRRSPIGWGGRSTLGIFFALMGFSIWLAFGHVFYMAGGAAVGWFMVCAFLLGLGGANFIVYSFWLPEQYGTECRASAFAFNTNVGRFAAAGMTFLVGAGVRHFQSLGTPVALTALAFVVGLLLLPFGVETKGKPLPA